MAARDRFVGQGISAAYAKYRPVYPKNIMDIIIAYMKSNGHTNFNTALDVACGSGQSTFLLCGSFKCVIGLDVSTTQIEQAKSVLKERDYSNVEFIVGNAHKLPIESSSVDLLTCANGWHWLDPELFYSEAKRVLKPNGCIAVYGNGVEAKDNQRIEKAFRKFDAELFQFNCFADQNLHILNKYKDVVLPFSQAKRVEFPFPQTSTFEHFLGFLSSTSMYREYCAKYPNNSLMKNLRVDYESEGAKCEVERFTLPGFVIMGLNE